MVNLLRCRITWECNVLFDGSLAIQEEESARRSFALPPRLHSTQEPSVFTKHSTSVASYQNPRTNARQCEFLYKLAPGSSDVPVLRGCRTDEASHSWVTSCLVVFRILNSQAPQQNCLPARVTISSRSRCHSRLSCRIRSHRAYHHVRSPAQF